MSNDGTVKKSNCSIPYGKDSSNYSGPADKERISDLAGSPTNLSHTLSGAEATQRMGGKGK